MNVLFCRRIDSPVGLLLVAGNDDGLHLIRIPRAPPSDATQRVLA